MLAGHVFTLFTPPTPEYPALLLSLAVDRQGEQVPASHQSSDALGAMAAAAIVVGRRA